MFEEERNSHCFRKYLGLFFATLLGAFLAVYVVTDMAINRLFNPMISMKKMEREFQKMDYNMMPPPPFMHHKGNIVDFIKTDDNYKFIVCLKPFNNNPDNIDIKLIESTITISGEAKTQNKHNENFTAFSQTYTLDNPDFANLKKKQKHGKYIITVPFKE